MRHSKRNPRRPARRAAQHPYQRRRLQNRACALYRRIDHIRCSVHVDEQRRRRHARAVSADHLPATDTNAFQRGHSYSNLPLGNPGTQQAADQLLTISL